MRQIRIFGVCQLLQPPVEELEPLEPPLLLQQPLLPLPLQLVVGVQVGLETIIVMMKTIMLAVIMMVVIAVTIVDHFGTITALLAYVLNKNVKTLPVLNPIGSEMDGVMMKTMFLHVNLMVEIAATIVPQPGIGIAPPVNVLNHLEWKEN